MSDIDKYNQLDQVENTDQQTPDQQPNQNTSQYNLNDNPLIQKLTPKQFNASVHFYEADHNLSHQDRVDLSNDLGTMVNRMGITRMLLGTLGFSTPTIYYKYYLKSKVPRFVHKPFLSMFIGLSTMIGVNEVMGNYEFEKKRQQMQSRSATQYEVWKAMDHHQASLFYLYYLRSSADETFILKDPRTYTEKSIHEVRYRPKNSAKTSNVSIPRSEIDNSLFEEQSGSIDMNQGQSEGQSGMNHWDQIRAANGFGPKSS